MHAIEIARSGEASVADQLTEMREWLQQQGIQPLELEPTGILRARVRFRAVFATADEAERFRRRFDQPGGFGAS